MSTRWYPLYQKGNPQLRIFLPNFWLKLIKPTDNQPKNIVQFHCSMEMTKYDIKNYLEKIYDVHPVHVRTRIALGRTHRPEKFIVKDDDVKIAYVVLNKDEEFTFPNIIPQEKMSKQKEYEQLLQKNAEEFTGRITCPGIPPWFCG